MATDKNINIKIKANSKDAQSGIEKLTSKINSLGKNKTTASLNKLNGAVTLAGKAFKVVTQAVDKAVKAIGEYIDLANNQIKAETQLEAAAKNNPYLNKENVKQLKNYASQLQSIGTIGDEQLLPMMAQLAAAGRTQTEIQDIMSAALDVSASGAMSLESAVKNLNKTYSGLSGELGESIPQIKSLTTEQLKNGDAVKVVANQYKGMAAETAKASGSGIQLKNAIGDLKEQLGMGWAALTAPVNRLFTNLITKVGNAIGKVNELLGFAHEQTDATLKASDVYYEQWQNLEKQKKELQELLTQSESVKKENEDINALYEEYVSLKEKGKTRTEEETKRLRELRKNYNDLFKEIKNGNTNVDLSVAEDADSNKTQNDLRAKQEKELTELTEQAATAEKQYLEAKKEEQALSARNETNEYIKKNNDALATQIKQIKDTYSAKRALGEQDTELAEAQEIYNAKLNSFISLVTDSNGKVSISSQTAQKRIKDLENEADALSKLQSITDKTKLVLKWSKEGKDAADELKETKESLVQMKNLIESNQLVLPGIDISEIDKAIENINSAIDEEGETSLQKFQEIVKNISTVMESVSSGLSNVDQYFDQYADTQLSAIQNESDEEAEDLKTQYENGIISYEEYLDKKDELDKKAAQKEYKIKLAQWQMDMATATVNAAQATLNALSSGTPPVNILNAVAAGLLGAAQVATVAANKPTAPSFATGGFLTGNSTQGDKIAFKGNAGEAILNANEQRNFMRYANGEAEGQGINISMPINITNNASNDTEVSVARQERQIQITIDKAVNAGFKNGTYTDSMSFAQSNKTGRKYL